jgi:hypothetical protein
MDNGQLIAPFRSSAWNDPYQHAWCESREQHGRCNNAEHEYCGCGMYAVDPQSDGAQDNGYIDLNTGVPGVSYSRQRILGVILLAGDVEDINAGVVRGSHALLIGLLRPSDIRNGQRIGEVKNHTREIARRYGVPVFKSYDKMLEYAHQYRDGLTTPDLSQADDTVAAC